MANSNDNALVADRFGAVAERFCAIVDSAQKPNRIDFVTQIYRILPKLIDEAISLPDVASSDDKLARRGQRVKMEEWDRLYTSLKEKLGEWNLYRQVFDPTRDTEAIHGSLADDVADIYGDLKECLALKKTLRGRPEDLIWEWRFGFYSHWGKHAMDALVAIHSLLQNIDNPLQQ